MTLFYRHKTGHCQAGLCALILLVLLLAALTATADDWPGPQTIIAFSRSGDFFIRIMPGKSYGDVVGFASEPKGPYAKAEFYGRQRDRSYRLLWERELLNPVFPYEVFLSEDGHLITLDNWHNLGYGKVVAIYRSDGAVISAYMLEQLYSTERIGGIRHSVSSRYWRCGKPVFTGPDQTSVVVHDRLGGQFLFDLRTGGFKYVPGTAPCEQE